MHVEGMHTHKLAPKGGIPHTARQKCEHRKRLQEGKCSQPKKLSPLRALECMHLLQQCQHGKSTSTTTNWHPRVPINEKAKPSRGATTIPQTPRTHRMERGFAYKCLPQRALPTLPLMCYRAETAKNWMSTTLQMTQGQSSGKPDNQLLSRTTFRTNGKPLHRQT